VTRTIKLVCAPPSFARCRGEGSDRSEGLQRKRTHVERIPKSALRVYAGYPYQAESFDEQPLDIGFEGLEFYRLALMAVEAGG
jgi:hypothetical protein